MSLILDLVDYAKKLTNLTSQLDRVTQDVVALEEDVSALGDVSSETLRQVTSNRDRAIDFRQRSEDKQLQTEQVINELREQVKTLTMSVSDLTRQVERNQDKAESRYREAKLEQQLQAEKLRNSLIDLQNQMLNRLLSQTSQVSNRNRSIASAKLTDAEEFEAE